MIKKPKCILTVDTEAFPVRAPEQHVDTLIYGRSKDGEWGIGRMMDIADRHGIPITFFLDFAEVENYGDEIIEVGKYIISRGHDLQVHCHYDLLVDKVHQRFPGIELNYHTWYDNEEIADFIVDYCIEQYHKCSDHMPLVFRGGAYRFGAALIKKLKEKGFLADASYNFCRPRPLPVNKQFVYENGLLELPLGKLPARGKLPAQFLNFNRLELFPRHSDDYGRCIKAYEELFQNFYAYFGTDTIATLLMHSWSFFYDTEQVRKTGYIQTSNKHLNSCAADFFDLFLGHFSRQYDFISASEAVQGKEQYFRKQIDFDAIFSAYGEWKEQVLKAEPFIRKKAGHRKLVVWGTGWHESQVMSVINFHEWEDIAFYISRDTANTPIWRTRPVKTYEEAGLSPDQHYVVILADICYPEIRHQLKNAGFSQYEDYFDIADMNGPWPGGEVCLPSEKKSVPCPICGSNQFEAYNSDRPRRCVKCWSVERHRTIGKLFSENLGNELLAKKILHVSPSDSERMFFRQAGVKDITTIDIRPQVKTNIIADICHMPQVISDSYDIVFANCVLNHVYDDNAALSEIHRVLRDKGLFITLVTESGGQNTVSLADPTKWYGQEAMEAYRVGTYRYYGEADFMALLQNHFEKVQCFEKYDEPSGLSCRWYVCEK